MPDLPSRRRTANLLTAAAQMDVLPRPTDEPVADAPGPDPDRVLLLGGGPVAGFGVTTHRDSLVGALAGALSRRTGRGAVVEARGRVGAALVDVDALIEERSVHRFDVFVIAVGLVDAVAGIGARRFRNAAEALVLRLQAEGARDTTVVFLRIPPASAIGVHGRTAPRRVDARVARLNRVLEHVAGRSSGVLIVDTPMATPEAPVRSTSWYGRCAQVLAERLSPVLTG